jgi:hypothetical protein
MGHEVFESNFLIKPNISVGHKRKKPKEETLSPDKLTEPSGLLVIQIMTQYRIESSEFRMFLDETE